MQKAPVSQPTGAIFPFTPPHHVIDPGYSPWQARPALAFVSVRPLVRAPARAGGPPCGRACGPQRTAHPPAAHNSIPYAHRLPCLAPPHPLLAYTSQTCVPVSCMPQTSVPALIKMTTCFRHSCPKFSRMHFLPLE